LPPSSGFNYKSVMKEVTGLNNFRSQKIHELRRIR
jgi:hypothetical protein